MKKKLNYSPAKATFLAADKTDIICTSDGFLGPGDPLLPVLLSEETEEAQSM